MLTHILWNILKVLLFLTIVWIVMLGCAGVAYEGYSTDCGSPRDAETDRDAFVPDLRVVDLSEPVLGAVAADMERLDDATEPIDLLPAKKQAYETCLQGVECASGHCTCRHQCLELAGHCANGIRDGDEMWIDCGGSCPSCPKGTPCDYEASGLPRNYDCVTCSCAYVEAGLYRLLRCW